MLSQKERINQVVNKWGSFIFLGLVLAIAYLYNYQHILFYRPCSIHQWRQCDCLSITLNYYKHGMKFFRPEVLWVSATGNSKAAPGECPILSYFIAFLWHIFGYHEYINRGLYTLICFGGLLAVYKTCMLVLEDFVWAVIIGLMLFTSPIFAYYANNFIIDMPAFSVMLIGWYFFARYYKEANEKMLVIAMLVFMFAGLCKITTLISVLALFIIFLLEWSGLYKVRNENIFKKPLKALTLFLMTILPVTLWALYAIYYNNQNDFALFGTNIMPIWECPKIWVPRIWYTLTHDLLPQFFNKETLGFIVLLLLVVIRYYKKANRFLLALSVLSFAGVIGYMLLWYQVFTVHDYYLTPDLIVIPLILLTFFLFLKNNYSKLFHSVFTKAFMSLVLLFCVYYATAHISIRYSMKARFANSKLIYKSEHDSWDWFHYYYDRHIKAYETITPYIRALGINDTDKVISIPDQSINITLYLMDQRGFTDFRYDYRNQGTIDALIKLGAKYLFVSDDTYYPDMLRPYEKDEIGQYQNIKIYDLRGYSVK